MPTQQEIVKEMNDAIWVMTEYAKKTFGLPDDFKITVKHTFAVGHQRSQGGLKRVEGVFVPYTKFALNRFQYPVTGMVEYDRCWKSYLRVLVAHEVAHVVQWYLAFFMPHHELVRWFGRDRGHGALFQDIYRTFRLFVNPTLQITPVTHSPDEVSKMRGIVIEHNELVGKKYMSGGRVYECVGYKPRNHKYPVLVSNGVTTLKMSRGTFDHGHALYEEIRQMNGGQAF